MQVPKKMPGLRGLLIALGLYGLVWIPLEGAVWQVVTMGVGTTAVMALALLQRIWGGRRLSTGMWLGVTAVLGLLGGAAVVLLTLTFMAVKTGLHAHGPEFTPAEIAWVWGQRWVWSGIGLLLGTAVGFLSLGVAGDDAA